MLTRAPLSELAETDRNGPLSGMRCSVTLSTTGTTTSAVSPDAYVSVTVMGMSTGSPCCSNSTATLILLDAMGEFHARDGFAEDPGIEEAAQRFPARLLHGRLKVPRAGLLELPRAVEITHPLEERLVADQAAQHVQHHRRLVVDDRSEHRRLPLDVPEPVAEVDGPL